VQGESRALPVAEDGQKFLLCLGRDGVFGQLADGLYRKPDLIDVNLATVALANVQLKAP